MSFLPKSVNAKFGLSVNPLANALIPGRGSSNSKVTLRNFAVVLLTTMAHAPLPLDTPALDTKITLTHDHVHPSTPPQPQDYPRRQGHYHGL
jgi:hypothetical protein